MDSPPYKRQRLLPEGERNPIHSLYRESFGDREGARQAYKTRFANKRVNLSVYVHGEQGEIEEIFEQIVVTGLGRCLNYVYTFGSWISDLFVDYSNIQNILQLRTLNVAIGRHCVDSLNTIGLKEASEDVVQAFERPFSNVSNVSIIDGSMKSTTFSRIFPNVSRLSLINMVFDDDEYHQLPNLQHFTLMNKFALDCDIISSIRDLWDTNEYIESINITMPNAENINWDHLTLITLWNSLVSLKVSSKVVGNRPTEMNVTIEEFCRKYGENLETLHLNDFEFSSNKVEIFLRNLPRLQEFRCNFAQNENWSSLRKISDDNNWSIESNGDRLITIKKN